MGKTCTAAKWAYQKMREGKTVYSNFPIKGAIPYSEITEVIGKVKNAFILVDEMGLVFDQLKMFDFPYQVFYELRQHRKDGVDLLGTAQSIFDVAYPIRRLIQFENRIRFKLGRFIQVQVRDPQPSGEQFGKHVWYMNDWVFKIYRTEFKVKPPDYFDMGIDEQDGINLDDIELDYSLSDFEKNYLDGLTKNIPNDLRKAMRGIC